MSILVWVLNCLQSLGIPQDAKELSLESSPLAKGQSWYLSLVSFNYDKVVKLASAPLLDDVERDWPVVINLKWRVFSKWQKGDLWDERYKVLASDRGWTHFLWFNVGLDVVGSLLLQFPLFSLSEDTVVIGLVERCLVVWVGWILPLGSSFSSFKMGSLRDVWPISFFGWVTRGWVVWFRILRDSRHWGWMVLLLLLLLGKW
jgi:hypothetical protein